MNLEELRNEINQTDSEIVRLIAQRVEIARRIGEIKKENNLPVTDPAREKVVITKAQKLARDTGISKEAIAEIYQQLIKLAKSVEGLVVAFQGEQGAYSEEAAFQYFGSGTTLKPCETLDEVFQAVTSSEVRFGIVPVENSLEGSILGTYDLLLESNLHVCGETNLRVSHCLITHPGMELGNVKKIYSHPQALGQSKSFLKHLEAEIIPTYDTAGSVKMIKEQHILDGAAVASTRAAEIYQMKILARGIEDNQNNFTRFFVLARKEAAPSGNDKTSIVFSVKHHPGALYQALQELAKRKLNLTKIESRPTRQKPWEYNFYVDFEGHQQEQNCREALAELEKNSLFLKILGSYSKAGTGK